MPADEITFSDVRFGRTECWKSGWRGKQNRTEVRVDGVVRGEIKGEENAAFAGDMTYKLLVDGRHVESYHSLKDAKLAAANFFNGAVR